MQRVLNMRIRHWQSKLLFVVAVVSARYAISELLLTLGVEPSAAYVFGSVVDLAAILLGARIFRGRYEPWLGVRPWWQMTAGPTLSRRLGMLAVGGVVVSALGPLLAPRDTPSRLTAFDHIHFGISWGIIAVLYLNSAAKLRARRA